MGKWNGRRQLAHGQARGHTGTTQITLLKTGDKEIHFRTSANKLPACPMDKLFYFFNLNVDRLVHLLSLATHDYGE